MKTKITAILNRAGLKANKGVTLFETVMVLSMSCIISAMAIPNFNGYVEKERLTGAASQVASDIARIKMNAVRNNRTHKISFTGPQTYSIFRDGNNNGTFEENETIETKDFGQRLAGVIVSSTANPVFSPRGTASSATITLMVNSRQKKISVNSIGHVTITQ